MATAATTVELDVELQRRLERIAESRHESAGALIRDAVQDFVGRAEMREKIDSPEYKAEYRRQRQAIADRARANPEKEAEYWAWADAVQCDDGWV